MSFNLPIKRKGNKPVITGLTAFILKYQYTGYELAYGSLCLPFISAAVRSACPLFINPPHVITHSLKHLSEVQWEEDPEDIMSEGKILLIGP